MEKRIIKKGAHRPFFRDIGLYFDENMISFEYVLDSSCAYDRGDEDQLDLNKLHGIGFFPSHHKNSARIGWRYMPAIKQAQLFSYCYINGVRTVQYICDMLLNVKFTGSIYVYKNDYFFSIDKDGIQKTVWVKKPSTPKLGYHLGLYIGGGNSTGGKDDSAMHDMKILQKRIV